MIRSHVQPGTYGRRPQAPANSTTAADSCEPAEPRPRPAGGAGAMLQAGRASHWLPHVSRSSSSTSPSLPTTPRTRRWPTLLHRRVGIGQEAEVPLVVPADQRHVPLHLDAVLAPRRRGGRVGQHGRRQARAVALPGAEQAATVNPWWGQGHKTAQTSESQAAPLAPGMLGDRTGLPG